ncbi:hypothetical protein STIAU_3777 [Stigmatella aurantiaca DW4/3-1]|uniref:Uncharacterized protein n=1 Tax=Stigmatella aurantiaca (strain DW4/3-1) TaxID=378806 RepID=Q096E4_STIAD|nr:hypothetical protein STIAU_3777 [Stigmatella aurantiaca DW4/3-1]
MLRKGDEEANQGRVCSGKGGGNAPGFNKETWPLSLAARPWGLQAREADAAGCWGLTAYSPINMATKNMGPTRAWTMLERKEGDFFSQTAWPASWMSQPPMARAMTAQTGSIRPSGKQSAVAMETMRPNFRSARRYQSVARPQTTMPSVSAPPGSTGMATSRTQSSMAMM